MKHRAFLTLTVASLCAALTGCGTGGVPAASSAAPPAVSSASAVSSSPPELTESDVLAAYAAAAEVYDWFDLCSLPTAGEPLAEDGSPYDPEQGGPAYWAVEYPGPQTYDDPDVRVRSSVSPELRTYADLDIRVRSCFSPALSDELLGGPAYRDIGGRLCTLGGARGGNLYYFDKTVSARPVSADRWEVDVTFWADFQEPPEDASCPPTSTVGFSTVTLPYERLTDGWRFTAFCPSDGLDWDADTVFTFNYYQEFDVKAAYHSYSDWELVCYLIHADGAYCEAPFDELCHRFLERPEDVLDALALLDGSPYRERYGHIDAIVFAPGLDAGWMLSAEEQADFSACLDACRPRSAAAQSVLEKIRAVWQSAEASAA